MIKFIARGLFIFVILLVSTSLMMDIFNTPFGQTDFFENHGYFFLIFITFFPRLTLLFSSVSFGGFVWWLGFFICPRILISTLATIAYFPTNPILVVLSWMIAIGGEVFEKTRLGKGRFVFHYGPLNRSYPTQPSSSVSIDSNAIETEFTVKES